MPVVSERPTSSAPAAATCAASQTTSSAGTSPCSVQPNAVEIPTSTPTLDARASRSSTMARTSSTICSRVLRTLASECAALADTGMVILCTPASMAASAPFTFGTSAITVQPGSATACRTTSAASAICGSSFAGTNEATSISRSAGRVQRRRSSANLAAVGIVRATLCSPSRGPTSLISTSGIDALWPMRCGCATQAAAARLNSGDRLLAAPTSAAVRSSAGPRLIMRFSVSRISGPAMVTTPIASPSRFRTTAAIALIPGANTSMIMLNPRLRADRR